MITCERWIWGLVSVSPASWSPWGALLQPRDAPKQVPQPWLCCHHLVPWEYLQCRIPAMAGGAFWLPSLAPTWPLPPQEPRQICCRCRLGIGTNPVKLSLGHGCPSQRQLLLMDGFRDLSVPCSRFTVFPLKVIINPVIAAALHNFLFLWGHPSIHPRLALMYRLCPFPGDVCAAVFCSSLPVGSSNPWLQESSFSLRGVSLPSVEMASAGRSRPAPGCGKWLLLGNSLSPFSAKPRSDAVLLGGEALPPPHLFVSPRLVLAGSSIAAVPGLGYLPGCPVPIPPASEEDSGAFASADPAGASP